MVCVGPRLKTLRWQRGVYCGSPMNIGIEEWKVVRAAYGITCLKQGFEIHLQAPMSSGFGGRGNNTQPIGTLRTAEILGIPGDACASIISGILPRNRWSSPTCLATAHPAQL